MDALSMLLEDIHLYQTQYHYIHATGEWSFELDKKDCIVFYLITTGGISIKVDDVYRNARARDVVMVPGGKKHLICGVGQSDIPSIDIAPLLSNQTVETIHLGNPAISSQGDEPAQITEIVAIVCHYDREITRPLLSALPEILPESESNDEQKMIMLDLGVKFLALESEQNRLGKMTIINRIASILMIECVRNYIEDLPEATDNWLKAVKDPYLAKALAVMHDRPETNWTIHKLAEVAGMSRSSFAEHFREVVGVPPLTYLTDYRLRLAARYLRLQENSISRISELVGYASDSTFSQAFKRVYKMSPRKYRQSFRIDGVHFADSLSEE